MEHLNLVLPPRTEEENRKDEERIEKWISEERQRLARERLAREAEQRTSMQTRANEALSSQERFVGVGASHSSISENNEEINRDDRPAPADVNNSSAGASSGTPWRGSDY